MIRGMDTGVLEPGEALVQLHATLDARPRPENVAVLVWYVLKHELGEDERRRLGKVARVAGRWNGLTSLPDDFASPVGGARQVAATSRLFDVAAEVDADEPASLLSFAQAVGAAIGFDPGRPDFLADPGAACFIAYFTAKRKLRRQFTLSGRDNPFDEIAELLFARCRRSADTDWWMIAQAYPTPEVLARLTEEQRGELLGRWFRTMRSTASALESLWAASEFDRERMIVRRGNDSSTWNLLCGAYNAARAAWLSCLAATEATGLLDVACPGKAMMLMAGDLAAWHLATGSGPHPDTQVWAALPLPWEVLDGRATCTAAQVVEFCEIAGIDPHRTGWTGPKPPGPVGTFRPTPELVHGVAVADPVWAGMLRGAGAFSGKPIKATHAQELSAGIPTSVLPESTGHPHPD